jgi:hypothetical protein
MTRRADPGACQGGFEAYTERKAVEDAAMRRGHSRQVEAGTWPPRGLQIELELAQDARAPTARSRKVTLERERGRAELTLAWSQRGRGSATGWAQNKTGQAREDLTHCKIWRARDDSLPSEGKAGRCFPLFLIGPQRAQHITGTVNFCRKRDYLFAT